MKLKHQLVTYAFLGTLLFSYLSPVAIYAETSDALKETTESTIESTSEKDKTTSATETTSSTEESTETLQTFDSTTPSNEVEKSTTSPIPSETDNERVVPYEFRKSGTVDIQSFINQYAEQVIAIATPNDMYPSVMLAQGILESAAGTSDLAKLANNFFGIKFIEGVDNGTYDYVEYVSNEYIDGVVVPVKSKFRKYKTPLDSFKDNAKKIRNGTIDKPDRYKGVLRSNTKTYKDATAALIAGGYATSPDYATKLNTLIETWHLQRYDQGSQFNLDGVGVSSRVFGENFTVRGWLLSPYNTRSIDVKYNGKMIGTGNIGLSRPDVNRAYPLYNQSNSGFSIVADTTSLPVGNSVITVEFHLSNDEVLKKDVLVTRPSESPILQVDSPTNNQFLQNTQTIQGWVVAKEGIKAMNVLLNGKAYPISNFQILRPDVQKTFPEYQTDKAGFLLDLNTLSLSPNKTYTLEVEAITKNDLKLSKSFIVKKESFSFLGNMDTITSGKTYYDDVYTLSGWVLSNLQVRDLSILVDSKIVKENIPVNVVRNDVFKANPSYGIKNSGFSTSVDFSNLERGKHTVTVRANFVDGTVKDLVSDINIEKKNNIICVDTLWYDLPNAKEVTKTALIKGWALSSKTKFDRVDLYLNNNKITEIPINQERNDVFNQYPQYNQRNSGFSYLLNTSTLKLDQVNSLRLEFVAANGTKVSKEYSIIRKSQPLINKIDNLSTEKDVTGDLRLNGWAIGNSQLRNVKVTIGNEEIGSNLTFYRRPDVEAAYPNHFYNETGNGFSITLNWDKMRSGKNKVTFTYDFADGKNQLKTYEINVDKLDDIISIDKPSGTSKGSEITIEGWLLSKQEVTSIVASIKNQPTVNSSLLNLKIYRPDVDKAYPNYSQKNSGFLGKLNLNSLTSGKYTLVLTMKKSDGSSYTEEKEFVYEKYEAISYFDYPKTEINLNNGDLNVRGWFLADEGAKEAKFLVNGTLVGSTAEFTPRTDVQAAYPQYNMINSGFSFTIANKYFTAGENNVKVIFVTKSGRTLEKSFIVRNTWTIVVDAGHGGIDSGAVGNGVYEKDINLAIALKAEEKLKSDGYTVIMTRKTDILLGAGTADLIYRAGLANSNNADLFVSIHQNSADAFSARGIETYYQELATTPSNGINQSLRLEKSKNLADKVQNQLIQKTGLPSRGVKTANFHVIRQTFMPAILVEGGFVTNPTDASLMKTAAHQDRMAEAIRVAVASYIAENK